MWAAICVSIEVCISQPIIRREIDHANMLRQRLDQILTGAVRQAAKGDINIAPIDIVGFDDRQIGRTRQVRKNL